MEETCPPSLKSHWSFPAEGDPSSQLDSTPVPRGSGAEELRLSSSHHTVGSFHSCSRGRSSMSLSMRFLLQNLTATKIVRRTRMMPQETPTASAKILISDIEAGKQQEPTQCSERARWYIF